MQTYVVGPLKRLPCVCTMSVVEVLSGRQSRAFCSAQMSQELCVLLKKGDLIMLIVLVGA